MHVWPGKAPLGGDIRYSASCDHSASDSTAGVEEGLICSMIQRLMSASICGSSSWPQGYCRNVTDKPAVCSSRKSSQT